MDKWRTWDIYILYIAQSMIRPTVCISNVIDRISQNIRGIETLGQSHPIAIACLNMRTSTEGYRILWYHRGFLLLCFLRTIQRVFFSRVIPYFARSIFSTFSISCSSSELTLAVSHVGWMRMTGLIFILETKPPISFCVRKYSHGKH